VAFKFGADPIDIFIDNSDSASAAASFSLARRTASALPSRARTSPPVPPAACPARRDIGGLLFKIGWGGLMAEERRAFSEARIGGIDFSTRPLDSSQLTLANLAARRASLR
jgi:hypothetical protein